MSAFFREHKKYLTVLAAAVLLLSLLPVYEVVHYVGDKFQGVPPSYIDDNYYYVRMKEVVDGYPWLGNPYFIEHRSDIAPAFVFPDWLYALPMILGLPLFASISIDFSLWSLVFGLLAYISLQMFGLPKRWSTIGALVAFTQVYLLILRPVSMQIVFPFYLLFVLAVFIWNKAPQKKRNILFLAATAATTFYDYGYLWQIVAVEMLMLFGYTLVKKDRIRFISLAQASVLTGIFVLPFISFTLKQIHNPFYWQTMERTGLVYTHLPTALAFKTTIWVIALCLCLIYSSRSVPMLGNDGAYRRFAWLYASLGISMSVVSLSNLITGKELEIAQHVGRFIILWLIIGTIVLVYHLIKARPQILRLHFRKKATLALLSFTVLMGNASYAGDLETFLHPGERIFAMQRAQEYIPAFKWLDAAESEPKVVWVDPHSTLSGTLEIFTKHYVLFSGVGVLQLASDDELKERYLVANTLREPEITVSSIAKDTGNFAGVSKAHHIANTHNRGVKLCRIFHLSLMWYACGELTDSETMNIPMAEEMYTEYRDTIVKDISGAMIKYHVSYIMKDKELDTTFHPEKLSNITKVYEDQRFVIYKVIPE